MAKKRILLKRTTSKQIKKKSMHGRKGVSDEIPVLKQSLMIEEVSE